MDPEEDGFDRTPPQDIDAEISVLGAMLLSKEAIADVDAIITADAFYRPAHATIFQVALELFAKGEPADAITVAAELNRRGDLNRVGGATYLHTLIASVPTAANATYYAHIVREQAILRNLVNAGTKIVQLGYADEGGDVDDLVDAAQREIMSVSMDSTTEDFVQIGPVVDEMMELLGSSTAQDSAGVPTGLARLDELTNGLHPGQLIIVAARPSMGKSTLALDFCRSASIHHGMASVFFSLEMGRDEIVKRMLSAESEVFLSSINRAELEDRDWDRLAKRIGRMHDAPLFIDDSPNLTLPEIRAKARRLKQQHDLKLVVIDYLQLMTTNKRVESRQQEVSEISRNLKLLAKELQVPVVAAAQLNRGPEQRNDKKPMMADLRESGSLEQDADVIMLLHRPDYYGKEDDMERKGEADIIVAKHRNGETRTVGAIFQGHYSRFQNMAEDRGDTGGL
ncbi:replicative DNA helicase [Boudabousia marimammalium]|uniref:Replicative DNA helicase n=1 Tax=Boudabousia marimammalium TaxID=156892 RepID=A0A1Q5PSF3_9ACTO|nr:replicative DNA helicase [Boudabousia marimammalium]OKL50514.1 replicative DNA helicase [Boudabousia marimammalium]